MKKKILLNAPKGIVPTFTTCYARASLYNFIGVGVNNRGGQKVFYRTRLPVVMEFDYEKTDSN